MWTEGLYGLYLIWNKRNWTPRINVIMNIIVAMTEAVCFTHSEIPSAWREIYAFSRDLWLLENILHIIY